MRKRAIQVGERFGKLEVIGLEPSDARGNQMVRVRCSCPDQTEKLMRLSSLTFEPFYDRGGKLRQPYRSCGCESKRAYRDHLEQRAAGLERKFGRKVLRRIWNNYQYGRSINAIAAARKLPPEVILAVIRRYNRKRRHPRRGA